MRTIQALAAAAVVLGASPAAAAVTTVVLAGVASGTDNGHLSAASPFGTQQLGVDLSTGQTFGVVTERAFTLTLRIDDRRGAIDSYADGDSIFGLGDESPMLATFSLNGFSYDLGNVASSFAKVFPGTPDQIYGDAYETRLRPPMTGDFTNLNASLDFNIVSYAADIFQERRFREPAQWTRAPGDISQGHLTLALQDTSGTPLVYVLGPLRTADLSLRFDTLSIASVPEPSAWALLIVGFGLAGAAVRRRRLSPLPRA